jgi:hypothetical protein
MAMVPPFSAVMTSVSRVGERQNTHSNGETQDNNPLHDHRPP